MTTVKEPKSVKERVKHLLDAFSSIKKEYSLLSFAMFNLNPDGKEMTLDVAEKMQNLLDQANRLSEQDKEASGEWYYHTQEDIKERQETLDKHVTLDVVFRLNVCFARDNKIPAVLLFNQSFFMAEFDPPPKEAKEHQQVLRSLETRFGKDVWTWDAKKEFDRLLKQRDRTKHHCGYLATLSMFKKDLKVHDVHYTPPPDKEIEPNDFRMFQGFPPVPQMPAAMYAMSKYLSYECPRSDDVDEAFSQFQDELSSFKPPMEEIEKLFLTHPKKHEEAMHAFTKKMQVAFDAFKSKIAPKK